MLDGDKAERLRLNQETSASVKKVEQPKHQDQFWTLGLVFLGLALAVSVGVYLLKKNATE